MPRFAQAESDLVEAFLGASRALVGLALRSLAACDEDVSLHQFRIMVILQSRGPQRITDLAGLLQVNGSTATRHADRLTAKGLLRRRGTPGDARAVTVTLTRRGDHAVSRVLDARRAEIKAVLATMPTPDSDVLQRALRAFATALGEPPGSAVTAEWGLAPS